MLKVSITEDKNQTIENINKKSGSDGNKVGQSEGRPQEMDYSINITENGPENGDKIAHNVEDVIANLVIDDIKLDNGNAKGWWHIHALSN